MLMPSPPSQLPPPASPSSSPSASPTTRTGKIIGFIVGGWKHLTEKIDDHKALKRTDAVLIAASVIAAMNYQAVISPPRGLYQETRYNHYNGRVYKAGEAIGAYLDPQAYKLFYLANTISFTSSMSTMFLILCGVSLQRRIFSLLTTGTMFWAITATTISYAVALQSITPSGDEYSETSWLFVQKIVTIALVGWLVVAPVVYFYFLWTQYRGAQTHKLLVRCFGGLRDFMKS